MKKAKNARSARYLKGREPKVQEDEKRALLIRGQKASAVILECMRDIHLLKKPASKLFTRKNPILPFEDETSIEFLCDKNDAALFTLVTHSKKRPHNMVLGRIFDGQVLDMIELGVSNYTSIAEHQKKAGAARLATAIGTKPAFVFQGAEFDHDVNLKLLKSILLDFFRGVEVERIALAGLERVVVCTAVSGKCYFRHYATSFAKSGSKVPRIELAQAGPSMDFTVRRVRSAAPNLMRMALKRPRTAKPKRVKNVARNSMDDKIGRLHVDRQDLDSLQVRKVRALKKRRVDSAEE